MSDRSKLRSLPINIPGCKFQTYPQLVTAGRAAKQKCMLETRKEYDNTGHLADINPQFILSSTDEIDESFGPFPEAEEHTIPSEFRHKTTGSSTGGIPALTEAIDQCKNRPGVQKLYICGGFNWAQSRKVYEQDRDYEPWAGYWRILIWERPDGQG